MDNNAEYKQMESAAQPSDADEHEHRHEQSVKLTLVVMQRNVGRPLDTDVYYGNRLIAQRGQPITEGMVARMRRLEPLHLQFTNEEPRLLEID